MWSDSDSGEEKAIFRADVPWRDIKLILIIAAAEELSAEHLSTEGRVSIVNSI